MFRQQTIRYSGRSLNYGWNLKYDSSIPVRIVPSLIPLLNFYSDEKFIISNGKIRCFFLVFLVVLGIRARQKNLQAGYTLISMTVRIRKQSLSVRLTLVSLVAKT